MQITATSALAFLPFVLPVCVYVCYTDMARMKIPNHAVLALVAIFLLIGPFVLPLPEYGMRIVHALGMLVLGVVLNAAGVLGAGDAKFVAAGTAFIHPGDLTVIMPLLAACLLGAFVTHRLARMSPIRRMVPDWQSWHEKRDFPMGLALGGALGLYLIGGAFMGS